MEPASQVQQSLDHLVFIAHKKFEKVVETQGKFLTARIEAGQALLELRARIEAGEAGDISWWDYYGQHFVRGRRDAERVMEIASQEDPQAANEKAKEATRQAVAVHRSNNLATYVSRKNSSTRSTPALSLVSNSPQPLEDILPVVDEIQNNLISQAIDIVASMNVPTRAAFAAKLRQIWRH